MKSVTKFLLIIGPALFSAGSLITTFAMDLPSAEEVLKTLLKGNERFAAARPAYPHEGAARRAAIFSYTAYQSEVRQQDPPVRFADGRRLNPLVVSFPQNCGELCFPNLCGFAAHATRRGESIKVARSSPSESKLEPR